MRISDWSSDVCSSDLRAGSNSGHAAAMPPPGAALPGSDRSKTAQASGHRSQESLPAAQARGSTCRIAWQSPDRELPLEEEESESLHQIGRASCRERVCKYV